MKRPWTKNDDVWFASVQWCERELQVNANPLLLGAGLTIHAAHLGIAGKATANRLMAYDARTKAGHVLDNGKWRHLRPGEAKVLSSLANHHEVKEVAARNRFLLRHPEVAEEA